MIRGEVNQALEPWIEIDIADQQGQSHRVPALLDTGFNGFLTLPSAWLLDMGLKRSGQARVTLADGSEIVSDLFIAQAILEGELLTIDVEAAETDPLAGMALLQGYDVRLLIVPGGRVEANAKPHSAVE